MRDDQQVFRLVKIEPVHDSETRAQRRRNQSRARCRANQCEMSQLKGMNPRSRPLPDNQVHAKIFHRRIQHFFHRRLQPVNFIHKKNFLAFERGQYRGQVAFALQQRSRAGLDRHVQFVGDNLRQRRFSQSWRPVQQHVVQRFAAAPRRIDRNLDIFFNAFLADVLLQPFRPHAHVNARVFVIRLPGHNPLRLSLLHHPFCRSIRHLSAIRHALSFSYGNFSEPCLASRIQNDLAFPRQSLFASSTSSRTFPVLPSQTSRISI